MAWAVAFFFATLFECDGENYNPAVAQPGDFQKVLWTIQVHQLGHCVSDVATNLIVLVLLLPSIWALQMQVKNKIVISVMFLLGLLYVHHLAVPPSHYLAYAMTRTNAAGTARLVIVIEDLFGMECYLVWFQHSSLTWSS